LTAFDWASAGSMLIVNLARGLFAQSHGHSPGSRATCNRNVAVKRRTARLLPLLCLREGSAGFEV
jgi:hypothetical protein